ncbi:hypothetical protein K7H94_15700 [Pantoea dispersa]|uniref:hypothetical protein n=1 Tax=Pantoea dispersa TaxID=59814 RepID=UPI001CA6F009|nr:hypothetical protein [Pantoea dispersa]QZY89833.1 hypothetical protein K7H94_15700 [Pantoea dispersa]
MMRNEDFQKFVNITFSADIKSDGNIMTFNFVDSSPSNLSFMQDKFVEFGLSKKPDIEGNDLVITTNSRSFEEDSIIFPSLDSLWRKAKSLGKLPQDYIVLREKISSIEYVSQALAISLFLKWSYILECVSNHSYKEKFIIYIPSDDGGKELVVESYERLDLILNINPISESESAADDFLKILSISDAQEKERKAIIRNAIYDFVSNEENKNIDSLISLGERIYNRYNDLLELYTNRFSVNKLLSEIEQKNLEYTSKINEFVSSSQTKAFAIPGALIAIGGIAKSNGFLDSFLIMVGLFYVYHITHMSNQVLNDSYNSLKKSIKKSFERYSKFEEGLEVKEAASEINKDLLDKVNSAQTRISKVNGIGKGMLWVGGVYLLLKWLFLDS